MVRREIVARKVARASAWLNDAEILLGQAGVQARDLAAFYLFLAIQECIDLAAHWISDAGWPPADDAASGFEVLAERGVLDDATATRLRAAVGLRNRIAHGATQRSTMCGLRQSRTRGFSPCVGSYWLSAMWRSTRAL